jgi:hypothetical protein
MPGSFWTAIIAATLGLLTLVAWRIYRHKAAQEAAAAQTREEDTSTRGGRSYDTGYSYSSRSSSRDDEISADDVARVLGFATLALFAFAGLMTFTASATVVSTKNIGVVTTYGRPSGTLNNGFHLVAPWQKVTELDGAIQTDSHAGKDDSPCTTVRIAHQSTACVDNSIRWRIKQDAADRLFRDYKDFANIRESLVTRELNAALNTVFKDFDPLATDENGNTISPSQDVLSASTTKLLQAQIGEDIEVLNVIVPIVHFDDQTQSRINALQAEVAATRIAKQKQQTADATAEANRKLADSVSKDPNVLVSTCFDILAQMVKDKQPIPAGFSCWPGGNSAVVVPSTK